MGELKKCQDCSYWEGNSTSYNEEGGHLYGVCCRFPQGVTRYCNAWCGEWTEENVRERYNND